MSDQSYGKYSTRWTHQAKYPPPSVMPELLREVLVTLRHARESKMHPTDIEFYDELIAKIEAVLESLP